jgi:hypothetical protein
MAEDTYTLKEMMQELRSETKQQSSALFRIEAHLATLNSKVAAHEILHAEHTKNIGTLSTFKTQVLAVWAVGVFVISTAVNKFL